jgi:mediator of RNA polymerase II transcription subunit 16, fungi type
LIAVQNSDRQLLVYLSTIDLPDLKQDPQMSSSPRISIENIRASVPYRIPKDSSDRNDEAMLFDASSHVMSHLKIVPTSDIEKGLQLPPTILAFFTPVITPMGVANDGQLGMSTVRRWHVLSAERKLHAKFESMPSKPNSSTLGRKIDLHRLEDVHLDQLVTTVQKVDGGAHLALGGADGSLALYDPNSLTPLYMANDSTEVTNLAQIGFVFPSYSRGLSLAVSPNACVAASLANDGKTQLTHVEYPSGLTYDPADSTIVEAAIAAIILSFARSSYSQVSLNDIMLLVTQQLDRIHYPQLIQSTFKYLFYDKDFISGLEPSNASKPMIARVLSLGASLGHNPAPEQRSQASMLSWLSLNIRYSALAFLRILQSVNQNGGVEWKDPEVCEIACNNIRWTVDLCKFLVDDLFEMADHNNNGPPPSPEKASHGSTTDDDPHIITKLMLVSIWPRSFLKMIARILRGIVRASQDPKTPLSPDALPAFSRMAALIEASPLKMESLEQLLSGVEKMTNQFYHIAGMSDRDKADAERFMLAHGQIPDVLLEVVPRILQDVLPMTRGRMDRLALYMEDYSWLGIREDARTKAFRRDFVVDVHRKRVLRRKGLDRFRRCVRCGSVSADLVSMRHWPQYLQTQILRCICEDVFAVVGLDGEL